MASKELMEQGDANRKAVLRYIKRHVKKYGFGPSLDEIAAELGFASKTTARYHVRILVEQGEITYSPGIYRSIQPTR